MAVFASYPLVGYQIFKQITLRMQYLPTKFLVILIAFPAEQQKQKNKTKQINHNIVERHG